MNNRDIGIVAIGGYVPRPRVSRAEIASVNNWANPSLQAFASGERSACNWDEDAITMAVAASREALRGRDRQEIRSALFGSTTAPYADRLNVGVVAGALGLDERIPAFDIGGSLRAGTSALLAAFDGVMAHGGPALCVASDCRKAAPASTQEMTYGHAAAALVIGPGAGLARLVGSASLTVDFVGHFRSDGRKFDYHWEERWIREEGYGKLAPRLINQLLAQTDVPPGEITSLCLPVPSRRTGATVAKLSGIREDALGDQLWDNCGDSGAAHPLLMLVAALHDARPGDKILVVGFGQGGDALLFEAGSRVAELSGRTWPGAGARWAYPRYLALSGLLDLDRGMRAETDKGSALTVAYRHRDLLLGLVGARCSRCGTHQIPRTDISWSSASRRLHPNKRADRRPARPTRRPRHPRTTALRPHHPRRHGPDAVGTRLHAPKTAANPLPMQDRGLHAHLPRAELRLFHGRVSGATLREAALD